MVALDEEDLGKLRMQAQGERIEPGPEDEHLGDTLRDRLPHRRLQVGLAGCVMELDPG